MSIWKDRLMRLLSPPKQYDEPKDWPQRKKNIVVLAIAYAAFTSPLSIGIYMPAAVEMQQEFHTTLTFISATVSVYILVIGIMPMLWASLCDYMGRRPIYIISMTIAIFGGIGCALAKSIGLFFVMRALQGLGTSSVIAVGGGTLSDVFYPGERGTAFGLFYMGPLVAPIVGPLLGGILAEAAGWRSTMWFMLACSSVAWFLVIFVLPETFRQRVDGKVVIPPGVDPSLPSSTSLSPIEEIQIQHQQRPPSPSASEAERTVTEDEIVSAHKPIASEITTTVEDHAYALTKISSSKAGGSSTLATLFQQGKSENPEPPASGPQQQEPSSDSTPSLAPPSPPASLPRKPKFFNPLRPLACLRHRINALAVAFNALGLGGQICLINTIPITFHDLYNFGETKIGLCMMSMGCGLALGSLLGGRYSDVVVRRWLIKQERKREKEESERKAMFEAAQPPLSSSSNKAPSLEEKQATTGDVAMAAKTKVTVATRAPPEIRLRSTWIGAIFLPMGFLMYGWSVQMKTHIAVPLIGCVFAGFGMMMIMSSTSTVLVDANADNNKAAAAVACSSFMRGVVGALGGILALPMMDAMGNGWLYTFWAGIAFSGFCGIIVVVVRAETWRQNKKNKEKDREV